MNTQHEQAGFAQPEDFFRHLEHTRIQALLTRDMPTLWTLHAPHYQLITPSGTTFTRQRYLGMIESGQMAYAVWQVQQVQQVQQAQPMQVRVTDHMAIVRYQALLGFASGNRFLCWHTDSYELHAGAWWAVWSQATALRDA